MIKKEVTGKMVPEVRDVTHCDACGEKIGYGFQPGITLSQHYDTWDNSGSYIFSICSLKCLKELLQIKSLKSSPGCHPNNRDFTISNVSYVELEKILKGVNSDTNE